AITVINTSIKTDSRSPVALVKHVRTVAPSPPRRGPKQTHPRRRNPNPRDPKKTQATPPPSTRSPKIACDWAERLLIYRQNRRSKIDRYAYLCVRGRERQCEKSS